MWFLLYICVCVEGFLCRCVHCVNTNLQTPSFFLSPSVSVHWVRYLETARSQLCQFDQYWHCVYSVCRCATAAHTCMFEFVRLITLGFCSNRAEVFVSLALGVCECARISVRVWLQCVRFRFFVTFSQCLCCVNAWLLHPDHLICTTCTGFGWRQQRFSSLFNVKVPVVSLLSVHAIYSTSHYAYSIYPSTHRGWLCTVICLSFTFSLYVYV